MKSKVELLRTDMELSHEILEDLLNQMNEYPDFFELETIDLKEGIISQDISEDLWSEWFTFPSKFALFKLKCIVDFTKSFPRIILYESYLQESLDSGIYLKDLKLQKEEVSEVSYMTKDEILNLIDNENFTKSHGKILKKYF